MASAQEGKVINETVNSPSVPHSNFNLSKKFATTTKFGLNTPIYANEFVPDDGPITINPQCDLRSYTLKAPMFGKMKKHVSFYQVPVQAILPLNWEKIVVNPSRGTDVSGSGSATGVVPCLDGVNTVVSDFPNKLVSRFFDDWTLFVTTVQDSDPDDDAGLLVQSALQFIVRWEMFFSHGNLLSHLGVHYGELIYFTDGDHIYSFDRFCEALLGPLANIEFQLVDDAGVHSSGYGQGVSHVRKCLDFMRQHIGPFVVLINGSPSIEWAGISEYSPVSRISEEGTEPLNFGRCCAYQIANAHYLTNDKVDYIYTADLYRQYVGDLIRIAYGRPADTFVFNGIYCEFDFLSGYYLQEILVQNNAEDFFSQTFWAEIYPYFSAIFGFNYSLRFMDYFVGARPHNLAIGDTSVQVDNNAVEVVDITKSIVKQRFLNAVGRVGSSIDNYQEQIFHMKPAYDWHNPKYLFSFDIDVYNSEIENTGSAQMASPSSVTSVLHGEFVNKEFTFSIDRHSWIIGIEYTDFERFYFTTQERNTMAIDRFDMFIPELQYVGDQELRRSELISGQTKELPFGYQLRDMQFKQSFDDCAGGFVDYLPGWLFKFNPYDRTTRQVQDITISPEFIRSQPTEIDGFYLSLTNMSLAGYFHFIEVWNIKVSAHRPMAYSPQIL